MITNKKLIGVRDPLGIRPLILGKLKNKYVLASETCALDIIGAKFEREVLNGEIVVIDDNGIKTYKPFNKTNIRPCIFEYIYFARPDSVLGGKNVYECRKLMGKQLAKESFTKADISNLRNSGYQNKFFSIKDGVFSYLDYLQENGEID